ncbi:hypothetical protein PFISCL1PPCAC_27651, partial [Pristionchus fissidentatus]
IRAFPDGRRHAEGEKETKCGGGGRNHPFIQPQSFQMSLSKISLRPLRNSVVLIPLRNQSARALPPTAAKQVAAPAEAGFFAYSRNWSRDKKFDLTRAPQKGDTPFDFLFRRLGHAYEVYPLVALCSWWVVLFGVTCWWSFDKVEIWLDRSKDDAPWQWERIRDKYWKLKTVHRQCLFRFDLDGRTHQRLEIMEILQDEMLEAAKKRGTR